ncbi:PepSY domain-containing protein [Streptomyces sp. NPDC059517]|uniref:PepSY domain-containing protein n=1 Tax=Streptomyces sp. NPDC059517 TaxID=3346855 RepID=UPI0036CE06AE
MKRASLVLLTSGALVAAITGTALAGGSDDASQSRSTSSASASASASPGPASDAPSASPSQSQSESESESGSKSGAPTTAPTTDDDTTEPATPTHPNSSVGSRRAGEIALAHVGGGTISEVEAETEHGRAVWSVKILKNGSR